MARRRQALEFLEPVQHGDEAILTLDRTRDEQTLPSGGHCGGRLRVIADVTGPEIIDQILEHVRREGLPRAPPLRRDLD